MPITRALVLGGGGSKGAFQAGVIYNLAKETSWDIIFGVSAGAINGAALAMYDKEEVEKAAHKLIEHWKKDITNSKVYKTWVPGMPLNYIVGYLKSGLYNTAPLKKFLESNLNIENLKKSNVDYYLGATNFSSGLYKLINKKETNNIIDWVVASASFPLVFPPVKINDEYYVDGALINRIPIKEALIAGAKHVDVIITEPFNNKIKVNKKYNNIAELITKTTELFSDELLLDDLKQYCIQYNATIAIYSPEYYLSNNSLDFSYDTTIKMIEKGMNIQKPFLIKNHF